MKAWTDAVFSFPLVTPGTKKWYIFQRNLNDRGLFLPVCLEFYEIVTNTLHCVMFTENLHTNDLIWSMTEI